MATKHGKEKVLKASMRRLLGMKQAGCLLGIATEDSFGPDPVAPFITLQTEVTIFYNFTEFF
ncbi:MAG: hypothetical protein U5J95_09240 [Balneolaceae bacterium]|nr:hypothetical protein [Balneolaceae bacterium]